MKRVVVISMLLLIVCNISAQNTVKGVVQSVENAEKLQGVSVIVKPFKQGTGTDSLGNFIIKNIPNGKCSFQFSFEGYETKDTVLNLQNNGLVGLTIYLKEKKHELQEVVIVSSSRTNSRIEDLPTKVEVLGTEELGEESQIKPGNIAGLLGDFAGIQIQQTNVATGSADMRIQGLQGKYTQILRDGMPLFGGYSGSFSILQLPPLDLQQIEMVKGAASTLYGGGAIAGMVNLVSKKPRLGSPERSFIINRSTLQENNLNTFWSARNEKLGYTFYAGGTVQNQVDVNKDGFSDVPGVKSIFIHPRFFVYGSKNATLILGYTLNYEDRKGGDMAVLNGQKDAVHQFFIGNKSFRNTADIDWEQKTAKGLFTAKASSSFFNRNVNTNVFGMKGNETIWYSELAYTQKNRNHNWVVGMNFNGDDFKKQLPDSSLLPNESSTTVGAFAQDDWKLAKPLTLQAGLRLDYNSAYGAFFLPRLSLMYKVTGEVTMRLGGGLGYKTPTLFNDEIDERDYHYLNGYYPGVQAERSYGLNYDINYKTRWDEWNLTFNQTFFYNRINHPLLLDSLTNPLLFRYYNAGSPVQTTGFETYVQARLDELEIYFGYVFTDAKRKYDTQNTHLPLIAKHKLASLFSFELTDNFRAGLEASYTGKQFLDNGSTTDPYLIMAAMVNYKIGKISLVLNCENLLDYRQNKYNQVVFPPYNNPQFPEIWAPLDGRVLNLSMQLKW
ncbi:MAG: TonB-dependent receptor [Bacteroidota bacterium]|nr:TonB-dependent receptor [Bacteroidota bacterium]